MPFGSERSIFIFLSTLRSNYSLFILTNVSQIYIHYIKYIFFEGKNTVISYNYKRSNLIYIKLSIIYSRKNVFIFQTNNYLISSLYIDKVPLILIYMQKTYKVNIKKNKYERCTIVYTGVKIKFAILKI